MSTRWQAGGIHATMGISMKALIRARSWPWLLLAAAVIYLSPGVALADEAADEVAVEVAGDVAGAGQEADAEVQSDDGGFDAVQLGASTLDAVIIRPLGALATVAGMGFFVVSAPFVAPSRDFATSWDIFVVGPAEYTFVRPLGTI